MAVSLSVLSSLASESSHSFLSPLLSHCGHKIIIQNTFNHILIPNPLNICFELINRPSNSPNLRNSISKE